MNPRARSTSIDWFQALTGFQEGSYLETQKRFQLSAGELRSLVNGRSYRTGTLELTSLDTLRQRVAAVQPKGGRSRFQNIVGDARELHQQDAFEGALFQVASQFNLLEMTGPEITPEQGVTRYQYDVTQGPACAIAAGAATIYRNYFAMVDGQRGQTCLRQLNGLADIGKALAAQLRKPLDSLWIMRNGYALCTAEGLKDIDSLINGSTEAEIDELRCALSIGLHMDVEVTEGIKKPPAIVSQAFCSALPVSYTNVPKSLWSGFAVLVLEAAYEATLLAGVLNAARGRSNIIFLTQLGGGAFGNDLAWIKAALNRALTLVNDYSLDIRMVNYRSVSPGMIELEEEFG